MEETKASTDLSVSVTRSEATLLAPQYFSTITRSSEN